MLIAEYNYDMDIAVQREEAKEEGMSEGMDLLALLIQKLHQDNRSDDIVRVSMDADFRNKLLQEYGLRQKSLPKTK